jgi:hypothetical protein
MPLPENCCSTSLFTPGSKRLAEGGHKDFGWGILTGCHWLVCLQPEQFSALRTLYISFRKAKLKRTWNSASLRAKTLTEIKENTEQCESKERDFKE